ncbi:isoprenyl transferase [Criibacterium bergeronii]|uniref:Isoprenyl transferase n=1 Tax=Criibacterium bergeronii TaxID=1871336 RepID=A0A371IMJ3_9FIRM|nr:isoprenyl transferase [Criibacterium bergeronii]MBS6062296.1 isoprenyl transferase [Peptostreptococcaceae bacterium]RDY21646.1 isoprenyl transferase [Criibacterium bergeronii]TRW28555.1 isoprenyl transferase [Criibacterium bergeronii]
MLTNTNLDMKNIPTHIGIIMDGNGRWAKKRFLPRTVGHKAGVETVREIVRKCASLNVKYLTLYAFSTENWSRPKDEVSALMSLIVTYLRSELEELNKEQVVIKTIGDMSALPDLPRQELEKAEEKTKDNEGLVLTLAINYGFRADLLQAINKLALENVKEVDDKKLRSYMYTSFLPDIDLLIRTSGEKRLSNFMMYEASYSELYFTDVLWPDFGPDNLVEAIIDYQSRQRRYGGLADEN